MHTGTGDRVVTVSAIQMKMDESRSVNIQNAEKLVRQAAAKGAQIICLPELFEGHYFCQVHDAKHYSQARELEKDEAVARFSIVAKELQVVLPISFYEKKNNTLYNSIAVIDADGSILGVYRKTHIPDGPGYSEKFYFSPGDTGFKVWNTRYAKIGIGICWDQWFVECSRSMALMGAELLFYPTAIGSEPHDPTINSRDHWQTCMQGQSGCNLVPLIAPNRIGEEFVKKQQNNNNNNSNNSNINNSQQQEGDKEIIISKITFYGSTFITDQCGKKVKEADTTTEDILVYNFNLTALENNRLSWGIFRDRRPNMYGTILTKDGTTTC